MSANVYVIEDYENETAFRPKKTNPIQTQFPKGQNEQRKPEKLTQLNLYRYISSTSLPTGWSFV